MNDTKTHSTDENKPLKFDQVLADERENDCPKEGEAIGLAFSGGGIRSATFNLGVIQALAEKKLLRRFHYLSTISGGSYIGSWLSLFIRNYGNGKVEDAEVELGKRESNLEHPAIRALRSYSNYLTPRTGLTTDTLVAVVTYLRNFLLNITVLILLMGALLILPRIAAQLGAFLVHWEYFEDWWYYMIIVLVMIIPTSAVALGLSYRSERKWRRPFFMQSHWLAVIFDAPVVAAAFIATCFYLKLAQKHAELQFGHVIGLYFLLWVIGIISTCAYRLIKRKSFSYRLIKRKSFSQFGTQYEKKWIFVFLLLAVPAGAAGGVAMRVVGKTILGLSDQHQFWATVTFGPPALIAAFLLAVAVHIGLMGRKFEENHRELWSVYGARLLALALTWAVFFAIAFYGTALLKAANAWIIGMGGVTWVMSTLFGVIAGKSKSTGDKKSKSWVEFLTRLAPYVFVLGLLLALSLGVNQALNCGYNWWQKRSCNTVATEKPQNGSPGIYLRAESIPGTPVVTVRDIHRPGMWDEFLGQAAKEYQEIEQWFKHSWALAVIAASGIAAALLLSWPVNINLFSLHHFYRNRLTRCYLGATNSERKPNPLTGFDPHDDISMDKLVKQGPPHIVQMPLHIIGAAINMNRGRQLAWQNRRAASFAFTPLYIGFEPASRQVIGGYRPTNEYGKDPEGKSIQLGTAMAISGAAASPNMGFHTSPAVAFLLSVFNVRLGRWCGNPGDPVHHNAWQKQDPIFSLRYWWAELTGTADLDLPFVSLSDGGHFENLGIYELVRRRCALILASDAGADSKYTFDDLAEARRKCYADFGVEFRFQNKLDDIRPQPKDNVPEEEWLSMQHYATAEIIYPGDIPKGTLIYWKTSLTADLPPDIMNYRRLHKDFPHETTADQFFDEAQFESYRHLGYEVAMRSLKSMRWSDELPDSLK